MESNKEKKFRWHESAVNQWQTNAKRTLGYVGQIDFDGTSYILSVSPGGYTSTWTTRKLAKNDFRKFLHDKS